jgi:hypothetical protein
VSLCRPVIVLGAERSDTSVCAEMVHAWGAYTGAPGELAAADELNPRGRWEYLPLWELLAEVGGFAAGASWWAEDFAAQVAAKAAEPWLAGRARGLVAGMAVHGRRREELMTAPQRSLYQFLRQKVHQPGIPLTDDYPMPPGWREVVTAEETLR